MVKNSSCTGRQFVSTCLLPEPRVASIDLYIDHQYIDFTLFKKIKILKKQSIFCLKQASRRYVGLNLFLVGKLEISGQYLWILPTTGMHTSPPLK